MGEAVGAAEPVGEGGRVAIAVAGLVEGEHDIAAAGEFDGKAVLGLARIDVAVDGEDAGGGDLRRGVRRDVEQGAHGVALGALEPDVLDSDAAGGLGQVGEQAARQDQDHAQYRQRPSAAHGRLPLIPLTVEPAFGFVCSFALIVIVSLSESRARAKRRSGSSPVEALS